MVKNFLKFKKAGFTLVEMLVSLAIFSLVMGMALSVFVSAVKSQRRILAEQQLLDQTSYIMEYMSRSLRMAKKDMTGSCLTTAGAGMNYETNLSGNRIRYIAYDGTCREFFMADNTLYVKWLLDPSSPLGDITFPLVSTTTGFIVNNFKIAAPSGWSQSDNLQPSITFSLDVSAPNQIRMKTQTTVSQRNLDVY
jgi:prepilin-type N-terminal cleavage/methylation domain-containing protein